ncbi:MAG TPA: response regulator transcription factor [Casimicrobiaceae bacterium]
MCCAAAKSVYIVEDSASIRACLVDLLSEVEGVCVVGQAETPEAAVAGIVAARPDYVVLDFQLRGGTGIEVMKGVRAQAPATAFIVLTNHATPQYRRLCMEAGARCFFDKTSEFERVREVIAGATLPS